MVIILVLLFQLIIGTRTMINLLKLNYTRKELANIIHKACLVIAIVFLTISLLVIILFLYFIIGTNHYYVQEEPFFITATVAFVMHLLFGCKYFLKESKKKLIIWLIFSFLIIAIVVMFILFFEPLIILGVSIILADIVFLGICLYRQNRLGK